jgi:hypothetical protein
VTVTADRNEVLGCLVWEMALRRSASTAPAKGSVKEWAHRAAQRVTALLQPLKVVEVDVQRDEALLRSDTAGPQGDVAFYYEVLLKGLNEAVVRRFEAFPQERKRRQQVLFPLTHEALAKVVADLAAGQD